MSDSTRKGPPASTPPLDTGESGIAPLPPEERRKLFDLPEPPRAGKTPVTDAAAAARAAADAPLELERDARAAAVEKAVTRIRVGGAARAGCGLALLRLSVVGALAGVALFAALRFVFRG